MRVRRGGCEGVRREGVRASPESLALVMGVAASDRKEISWLLQSVVLVKGREDIHVYTIIYT